MRKLLWMTMIGLIALSYSIHAQENALWKFDRPYPESEEDKRAKMEAFLSSLVENGSRERMASSWVEMGPTRSTINLVMHDANYRRIRGTGRVSFIEFDTQNEMLFAGSPTGGLFVRTKNSAEFENAGTDRLPNPGISHFQHDERGTWYIATGDGDDELSFSYGVFRSTDKGRSWRSINGNDEHGLEFTNMERAWDPVTIRKMLISLIDRDRLFVASSSGLFVTLNAGEDDPGQVKWEKLLEGEFYDVIDRPFYRYEQLFAGGREIYFSTDGGGKWRRLPGQENTVLTKWKSMKRLRSTLRISADDPNKLYIAVTGDDGQGSKRFEAHLYVYHIDKEEWEDLGEIRYENGSQRRMGAGRAQSFDVSPNDADLLIMGNVSKLWISRDGGKNWEAAQKDFHDDLHWACFNPYGKDIWIGTDGGVNRSPDMGKTWQDYTVGLGVANIFNIAHSERDHRLFMYGGYDTGNNLYRGEEPWIQVDFGDGFECHISDGPEDYYYYTSTHSGLSRHDTMGAVDRITPGAKDIGSQWKRQWIVHEQLGYLFYPGNKKLLRSPIGERMNWEVFAETSNNFWEIFCLPNERALYATMYKKGGIYRTFDALASEVESEILVPSLMEYMNGAPFESWPSGLAIQADRPEEFWVSYEGYGVGWEKYPKPKVLYFNGSGWEDWTGIAEGDMSLRHLSVTEIVYQHGTRNRVYIGTNAGVFFKEGRSDTWKKLEGLPHADVAELEINYNSGEILAGTHGRGLWLCDLIPSDLVEKIKTDTEWQDVQLVRDIVVKKGSTLRLMGEIRMAKGVGIYIEPGGRLELDGARVHNPSGLPWGGIELGQSKGFLFFKGKRGKLELINGARIE